MLTYSGTTTTNLRSIINEIYSTSAIEWYLLLSFSAGNFVSCCNFEGTLGKMQTFSAFLLIALVTICLISFLSASAIPESIDQTGLELAGLFNKECEKFSQEILWCTMEIVYIFFSNKFISLALNLILTIIDLSEFSARI
ncbi:hypothetical protein BpHYR1_053211 [Brachionus plicatilis]|uniref:Uncharacterized protein n=1 Tax=Brachionus plicatilis TaxID=10195 RepID=A0A3M7SIJ8_BRAPC|nr:hypothetical protein BpHYR1_053211 [Brachionus plicatilis]